MTVLVKLNTFECEGTEVTLTNEGKKKWKLVDNKTGFQLIQQVHSANEENGEVIFKMKGRYWKYLIDLFMRGYLKFYTVNGTEIPCDFLVNYDRATTFEKPVFDDTVPEEPKVKVVLRHKRVSGNPLAQMKQFKQSKGEQTMENQNQTQEIKETVKETVETAKEAFVDQVDTTINNTKETIAKVEQQLQPKKTSSVWKAVGGLALVGGLAAGGYFLYKKYLGGGDVA
jgi:hypothetical protein